MDLTSYYKSRIEYYEDLLRIKELERYHRSPSNSTEPTKDGWIGVDLDGTLAEYHGWAGMDNIGKPVKLMVDRVKAWLVEGRDVRIFTARVCPQQTQSDIDLAIITINDWCEKHIGRRLPITCIKDKYMQTMWDDRCIAVERNTGKPYFDTITLDILETALEYLWEMQSNYNKRERDKVLLAEAISNFENLIRKE